MTDNAGASSSSAPGNHGLAIPPHALPESESGFDDSPIVVSRQVIYFGQGTLGRIPQRLAATTSDSVSRLACPRHFAIGQEA